MLFSQRQHLTNDTKKEMTTEAMIVDTLLENTATTTAVPQTEQLPYSQLVETTTGGRRPQQCF
ncbi:hypothetical protein KIN20_006882 [Parelaphostrongylus tenuis]|uniref:Uncharacterized protein n=1 Tax=Parelaphostrongylus tenuis TaxID=148309 RepID=A0AAD5QLD5_PARTN|nr:hypothetical protein KIN20_006882 [Parelaphostrongylus tenuis]